MKPGGRFVATDLYDAGGVGARHRELIRGGLVHAGAPNVDGRTLGEIADGSRRGDPGQEVVLPIDAPL